MSWLNEQMEKITTPIADSFEEQIDTVIEKVSNGALGRLWDTIESHLSSWANGIADFFNGMFEAAGEWLSRFIAEVPSDAVVNNAKDNITSATQNLSSQIDEKGYETEHYYKAIEEAITHSTSGWSRVVEYLGVQAGAVGSSLGSMVGMESEETTDLSETREETAMRIAKTTYDNVYKAVLKDIGFTDEEIEGTTIGNEEDHHIDVNMLEGVGVDKATASIAAAERIASLVAGVDFSGNEPQTLENKSGQPTGVYGYIKTGDSQAQIILRSELPSSDEFLRDAKAEYADRKQQISDMREHIGFINELDEDFVESLSDKQFNNLLRARANNNINDIEADKLATLDLPDLSAAAGLSQVLASEQGINVEFNEDANQWEISGTDANGVVSGIPQTFGQRSAQSPAVGE